MVIERLPPERHAPPPSAAAAGGCCSCCCCCLHSLGGLVGSAVAMPPSAVIGGEADAPRRTSARKEYWLAVLAVAVVGLGIMAATMRFEEALMFAAIFLPGGQLAASLIAVIASQSSSTPGHAERLRHLGKITLFGVLGGLLGFGVMYLFLIK